MIKQFLIAGVMATGVMGFTGVNDATAGDRHDHRHDRHHHRHHDRHDHRDFDRGDFRRMHREFDRRHDRYHRDFDRSFRRFDRNVWRGPSRSFYRGSSFQGAYFSPNGIGFYW